MQYKVGKDDLKMIKKEWSNGHQIHKWGPLIKIQTTKSFSSLFYLFALGGQMSLQ